jgi:CubicO group peptidase (beta-lactamase class C family)
MVELVRRLLDDAIARGLCSGAAIAVGDAGREVHVDALGTTHRVPTPGVAIDTSAIFDLASVSKPHVATIAAALVSRGRLALDTRVHTLVAGVDPRIELRHLLGHGTGWPAHKLYYERIYAGDLAGQPDPRRALVHMAASEPLVRDPGEVTLYSDLGYIVLGAALEAAGGAPLEQLFAELVAGPLDLATRFVDLRVPREQRPPFPAPVVATEVCPRRGLVEGEVHDDNCHSAGGIAGHAGLFASVHDVSAFGRTWIELLGGADRAGVRADVARSFATTAAAPGATHRMGWDTPSFEPGVSQAGDRWPRTGAVGHTGFTGTSLWLDVAHRRWVALLTNRVHPTRDGELPATIKELRRSVMDAVVDSLD